MGSAEEMAAAYDEQVRDRRVFARGDVMAHPRASTERVGPVLRRVVPGSARW